MKMQERKKMENIKYKKFTEAYLSNARGFTLTEMLIVIALIGIVGTLVITQVAGRFETAKVNSAKIQIRSLSDNLTSFRMDCNRYPTTEQGLEALASQPEGGCKNYPEGGYIKKLPKDPWDNPYIYSSDGRTFEIISLGADGLEGGEGNNADISSNTLDD